MSEDWQPIESAPNGWLTVSMRDVDREAPIWRARRVRYEIPPRKPWHRPAYRSWWIADDGGVCAPTHWKQP